MRMHTLLCLILCLTLLSACGTLPIQEDAGSGSGSGAPMESSVVQQEETTEPNSSESGSSTISPESLPPQETEDTSVPDAAESATAGESEAPSEGNEGESVPSSEGTEEEPEAPAEPSHWLTVGNDSTHSSPYRFVVPEDGMYTFQLLGETTARLDVYVLEEAFEDGMRYLPQAYRTVALGADGSVPLKAGCWVYCFSSTDFFSNGTQGRASSVLAVDYTPGKVEQATLSQPW